MWVLVPFLCDWSPVEVWWPVSPFPVEFSLWPGWTRQTQCLRACVSIANQWILFLLTLTPGPLIARIFIGPTIRHVRAFLWLQLMFKCRCCSDYEQQRMHLFHKHGIDLEDTNGVADGTKTKRMDRKEVEMLMGDTDGQGRIFTWREKHTRTWLFYFSRPVEPWRDKIWVPVLVSVLFTTAVQALLQFRFIYRGNLCSEWILTYASGCMLACARLLKSASMSECPSFAYWLSSPFRGRSCCCVCSGICSCLNPDISQEALQSYSAWWLGHRFLFAKEIMQNGLIVFTYGNGENYRISRWPELYSSWPGLVALHIQ